MKLLISQAVCLFPSDYSGKTINQSELAVESLIKYIDSQITDLYSNDEDSNAFARWANVLDNMDLYESPSRENVDENEELDVLNGNVLMVDQLWLWVIDEGE